MVNSPWLSKPKTEFLFICLPPFFCLLLILLLPSIFQQPQNVNTLWWLALVLVIDVSHVYSTLYRTYFDKQQWQLHKPLLIAIPILCFLSSIVLFQLGSDIFWRVMAYIAVFHFIRQQYGFVKVYQRKESSHFLHNMEIVTVYASMLYPLLYWHCYGPFQFTWFIPNDFLFLKNHMLEVIGRWVYLAILFVYLITWIRFTWLKKSFNLPVLLVIVGTALNWYFGIVYFKSDLAFTLLNVICHGIPYITIVWLFTQKSPVDGSKSKYSLQRLLLRKYGLLLFLFIPLALGYLEEGFWDAFVWKDHPEVFAWFYALPQETISSIIMLIVPLLITPQLTHYVLDGFIWKVSKGHVTIN